MGGCRCQLHVCPSVTGHHAVGMLMTQEGCVRLVTVTRALGIMPFLCHFTAIHEMFVSKMCLDLCPSYPNVPQGHGSCPLFPVSCAFWKIPVSERWTPPNMRCASGKPPGSSACPAGRPEHWLSAVPMISCSSHVVLGLGDCRAGWQCPRTCHVTAVWWWLRGFPPRCPPSRCWVEGVAQLRSRLVLLGQQCSQTSLLGSSDVTGACRLLALAGGAVGGPGADTETVNRRRVLSLPCSVTAAIPGSLPRMRTESTVCRDRGCSSFSASM